MTFIAGNAGAESPWVQVLLATYNGERFLREQIDSLLAQDYPNLTILARDDGSRDATQSILADYAQRFPDRILIAPRTAATGSARDNFLRLLELSTAPYVCLADQDDVWVSDKVSKQFAAMQRLEQGSDGPQPLLIFSDLQVVDAELMPLQPSFWQHQGIDPTGIQHFSRLITQNVLTGCTALMNRALVKLSLTIPAEAYMHDWWIALIACALGRAAWLTEPTVLYRQHGGNVLGAADTARPALVPRWRYHEKRRAQWELSERQAGAFLRVFADRLPPEIVRLLLAYRRCETSPNRLVRVATLLRNRFLLKGVRPNLAMLWYLWDMNAAKRQQP